MMSFSDPSATRAAKPVFALILLIFSTLTPLVASHAVMAEPIPYSSPIQKNGPLDGTTFPCHNGGGALTPPVSGYNIYPLGSKQPLKFTGTAVHGGGSCQISITYDNPPTKDSKFKVIKSIEGGCVARDEPLNRGGVESAEAPNPDEYDFTIPDDIPTGNGTIAWTWFNKIGNPEMYMSCAPLQITGTDKPNAKETFEQLPEIFKANIDNGCGTPDGKDILFPNPGKNVDKLNGAGKTEAFATPTGQGCQKPSAAGSGDAGAGAGATTAAGGATTSVAGGAVTSAAATWTTQAALGAASSASAPACSAPTGTTSPSSSASAPASTSASAVPSTFLTSTLPVSSSSSPPPPASTTSAPPARATSARAEGLAETVPPTGTCPPAQDGWYVCHLAASSHYGQFYHRCAAGQWTDKMPVPSGMQCTTKGGVTDAAARNAPEQELALERVDDDGPIRIIPVTDGVTSLLEARTETAAVSTAELNAPVRPTAAAKKRAEDEEDIYTYEGMEEGSQDKDSDLTTETTSPDTDRRSPEHRKPIMNSKKPTPRFFSRHLSRNNHLQPRKHHGRPSGTGGNHKHHHDKR